MHNINLKFQHKRKDTCPFGGQWWGALLNTSYNEVMKAKGYIVSCIEIASVQCITSNHFLKTLIMYPTTLSRCSCLWEGVGVGVGMHSGWGALTIIVGHWWVWVGKLSGYQLQSSITPRAMLELLKGVACAKCKLHFELIGPWEIFNNLQRSNFQTNSGDWWLVLIWISLGLTGDESTLVQVITWCNRTPNHYLGQCWPRSLLPYGITRLQWGNFL